LGGLGGEAVRGGCAGVRRGARLGAAARALSSLLTADAASTPFLTLARSRRAASSAVRPLLAAARAIILMRGRGAERRQDDTPNARIIEGPI
jgi:hypothetical protein